jgi:hypothetical protein
MNLDVASMSKAIAGGLVSLLIAELARFGFNPDGDTLTAIGVIVTGVVAYLVGHLVVYLAPANKPKGVN